MKSRWFLAGGLCAVLALAILGATNLVQVNTTSPQTISNKTFLSTTLTAPAISSPVVSGTATGTYTLAGTPTIGLIGGSGYQLQGSWLASTATISLPTITGPVITNPNFNGSATGSLTNLALISPTISSIVNTGTLALPTSTDTLVGRATTDTLTNKTLTAPVLSGSVTGTYTLAGATLSGTTTNSGTISGGTLAGTITNSGTISGGTLAGTITNSGTISGGTLTPSTLTVTNPRIINPSTTGYFQDEFCGYLATGNSATVMGQWESQIVGATGAIGQTSSQNHPCLLSFGTDPSVNASTGIIAGKMTASDNFTMTCIFQSGTGAVATTIYVCGPSDSPTPGIGVVNNGIYVWGGGSFANWNLICRASGVQTAVDTGIAIGVPTWHRFTLTRTLSPNQASLSVDGGAPVSCTTNLPSSAILIPGIGVYTTAASSVSMWVDYFDIAWTGLSR